MADYVAVQAHHIIPLGVFNDLKHEVREEFHRIFDTLQKESKRRLG
ncbi:hypothetical protein [Conchiformibius kuhniae]|uniref:Uncharacterized protein n=1 Tax=Conchiformibius kuhniae TaxID=211502 RepID=A0A8T9MVD8_9NEIS|nr:hypothetical protein [Conchiformibius kuhniae]UOP04436.1 hypothetical protein LVJ77_09055 [Conchiformibius kuhniae]